MGAYTMDIKKLDPVDEDAGVFVSFPDAAGVPLIEDDGSQCGAVVSGTYSTFYRDEQKRQKDAMYKAARRGDEVNEQDEDKELALEAACIRSWTLTADGQPYPITFENWKAVADAQPQWRLRVQRQMHDHAAFFKRA